MPTEAILLKKGIEFGIGVALKKNSFFEKLVSHACSLARAGLLAIQHILQRLAKSLEQQIAWESRKVTADRNKAGFRVI